MRRGQQEWCSTAMRLRFYFTFVLMSSILYALIFDTVLSNEKWYYCYIRAKFLLNIWPWPFEVDIRSTCPHPLSHLLVSIEFILR